MDLQPRLKELFDIKNDPEHIVINLEEARVHDHSGLDALQNIIDRYKKENKKSVFA